MTTPTTPMMPPDPVPESPRTYYFDDRLLGREVRRFRTLGSTNTQLLALANDPNLHGLALVADAQTAGRGQYGRRWVSGDGASVLMSVLVFPPEELRHTALLTSWAAVSVCEAIFAVANAQAKIRWPNDVLISGRKVCGILIEQRTTGHPIFPVATVVGIGLNVGQLQEEFDVAGLPAAGSLRSTAGVEIDAWNTTQKLLHELDAQYRHLLADGPSLLESLWKWRLGLLGRNVEVELSERRILGRLIDLSLTGVYLQVASGSVEMIAPNRVLHVWQASHSNPDKRLLGE